MLRREFLQLAGSAVAGSSRRSVDSVSLALWPSEGASDEIDEATYEEIREHTRRAFGAAFDDVEVVVRDTVDVPSLIARSGSERTCTWWWRQSRGEEHDANLLLLSDAHCGDWDMQGYAFYQVPYGVLRGASNLPERPYVHCLLHELGHCFDLRHHDGTAVERRVVVDRQRTGPRVARPSHSLYDVEERTLATIMSDSHDYDGYALEFSDAALEKLRS